MTTYTQHRHLGYAAPQLFDLVTDVERYPEFLPWVLDAAVRHRDDRGMKVEMTIKAGPVRKRFLSVATLDRPHQVDITSHDPIFERFEQRWKFAPGPAGGTDVGYHVDVTFQSRVLQAFLGSLFAGLAADTISAFSHRAHRLLGGR